VAAAGQSVPHFEFRVVQLNRLHWEAFRDHPNAVAAALMARIRIAPEARARVKWECCQMMATLRLNPKRARRIVEIIEGYLRLDEQEQRSFDETLEAIAESIVELTGLDDLDRWLAPQA
jgi:hypothetical protein